jgi:hypothetical protein
LPREGNAFPLSACEPFGSKMVDSRLKCLANLATESGFRQTDPLARDELTVKPGGAKRRDLRFDWEIRPCCKGKSALSAVDSPDLDNSADGRCEL